MKKIIVMAAILALAAMAEPALAGQQRTDGVRIKNVTLEEVLSIGTLDDDALIQWSGVATDVQGSIYVLDMLDYSLKKFDAAGRLVRKTGRKGQGPGEFITPVLLARAGDRLYSIEHSRPGIQVFDTELKFLKMIPFDRPVFKFLALPGGKFAVSGMASPGGPAKIAIIDEEGRMQSEFVFMPKVDVVLTDSVALACDRKGDFYLAYLFQDLLEKRDARGNLLWSWSESGDRKVKTRAVGLPQRSVDLPEKTFYKDVVLDPAGRLLVLAGDQAKHPSRDVRVFGPDGQYRITFTLPEASHCLHIDEKGFLYARANGGVTLKKYRLRYE